MKGRRGNVEGIYPLTPMQEGMVFHSRIDPESGTYYEQVILEISGDHNSGFMTSGDKYTKGLDDFFTPIFGERVMVRPADPANM